MALKFLNDGYFAGKVGIGTESPTTQLHLKRTSGDVRGVMVETTVTTSFAEVQLKAAREFRIGTGGSGSGANAAGVFYIYDATAGGAAGHRFEISSDGDVQARRTRSNTAGDVALSLQPTDSTIHYGFRIDSATNSFNLDRVGTGTFMTVSPTGNVGIGTTSPSRKLVVSGAADAIIQSIDTTGAGSHLRMLADVTAQNVINWDKDTSLRFATSDEDWANYSERMRITGAGNVGIGVTPTASGATTNLEMVGGSTFASRNTGGVPQLYISSNGVGQGYTQTYKQDGYATQYVMQGYDGGHTFSTAVSGIAGNAITYNTRLAILNNGNVGIGTTGPGAKLHVAYSNSSVYSPTSPSGDLVVSRHNTSSVDDQTVGIRFDTTGFAGTTTGQAAIQAIQPSNLSSADLAFLTRNNATFGERMRISSAGAIKFNAYDSTNQTGTPTYLLGTDASGNIVKTTTVPGSGAGPYLPLSAGPSYPLTGDLYQTMGAIGVAQTDQDYLAKIYESNADGFMSLYTGQPTPLERIRISSYGDSFFVPANNGKVGIGTTTPNNLLSLRKDVADGDVAIYLQNYNSVIGSTNETVSIKFAHGNDSGTGYVGAAIVGGKEGDFESNPSNVKGFISFNTNNGSVSNVLNERMRIEAGGNVGIGTTSPTYKLSVSGGIEAGGLVTYSKVAGSLSTTGYAVAGLTAGFNGASAGFEFKCYGSNSKYQRIVYSCHCSGTTWVPGKVIDEGTNDLDVVASANGATITFTFKARSSTQNFSPRIVIQATGHSINSTYA